MTDPPTCLVVGASGATGRLLVADLLARGCVVKAVVRSADRLPDTVRDHTNLIVITPAVLDMSPDQLAAHLQGCDAVASCLGHNLTLNGMYGKPRRLVTNTVRALCEAARANAPQRPTRFVLMNTTGVRNPALDERVSLAHRCVVGLLRILVPPHADNEQAAAFLHRDIPPGDPHLAWSAVRPDSLIDSDTVTPIDVHPSPTRDAIFDSGKTSRINVAHFMADLITDDALWEKWKGQMPVVYNAGG